MKIRNIKNPYVRFFLIVALCVVMFGSGYFVASIGAIMRSFELQHRYYDLHFVSQDARIYFDISTWGLFGRHSDIVITTEDPREADWKFDPDRDCRFMEESVYYEPKGDSLIVYSGQVPDLPKNFKSDIALVLRKRSRSDRTWGIFRYCKSNDLKRVGDDLPDE